MTAPTYALTHELNLRQRDNQAIDQWAHTMFRTPDMPLADRAEKATRELEAWYASPERARIVEQIHLERQTEQQVAS